jgi:ABC-type phosphate/phosphonate transport system substrate-binding protein
MKYRVVSRARVREHLLLIKKGERAYRGWLAMGTEIEGQVVQDAAGTEWVFFEQDGASGFIWKARVTEVPEVELPARDDTPGS